MLKIVVCVSGGGTNLQAIIDGIASNTITNTQIVRVISNNKKAFFFIDISTQKLIEFLLSK